MNPMPKSAKRRRNRELRAERRRRRTKYKDFGADPKRQWLEWCRHKQRHFENVARRFLEKSAMWAERAREAEEAMRELTPERLAELTNATKTSYRAALREARNPRPAAKDRTARPKDKLDLEIEALQRKIAALEAK